MNDPECSIRGGVELCGGGGGGGVEAYLRAFVYMCVRFPLRLLRLVFREKG